MVYTCQNQDNDKTKNCRDSSNLSMIKEAEAYPLQAALQPSSNSSCRNI
jgi:hypothetical protein